MERMGEKERGEREGYGERVCGEERVGGRE